MSTELRNLAARVHQLVDLPEDEIPGPDAEVVVGMRADAVDRIPRYGRQWWLRKPRKKGQDVFWYYRDVTLKMAYAEGHWRVVEIADGPDRRTRKRVEESRAEAEG